MPENNFIQITQMVKDMGESYTFWSEEYEKWFLSLAEHAVNIGCGIEVSHCWLVITPSVKFYECLMCFRPLRNNIVYQSEVIDFYRSLADMESIDCSFLANEKQLGFWEYAVSLARKNRARPID